MKVRRTTEGNAAPGGGPPLGPRPETRGGPDKSIYWILGGLVITGILAGYHWLRSLPRD